MLQLERHPVTAAAATTALAALLLCGALSRLFLGLFAARSGRTLEGLAWAALGIALLVRSARRSTDWRLIVAATSAASAFYYAWRAEAVTEGAQRAGIPIGGEVVSASLASGSAALVLFLAAGVLLGVHLLGSWRDD